MKKTNHSLIIYGSSKNYCKSFHLTNKQLRMNEMKLNEMRIKNEIRSARCGVLSSLAAHESAINGFDLTVIVSHFIVILKIESCINSVK